jgi:hypothetical protein
MSPSLRRFQQLTLNRWPACALLLVIANASASSTRRHPVRFDIIKLSVIHPYYTRETSKLVSGARARPAIRVFGEIATHKNSRSTWLQTGNGKRC